MDKFIVDGGNESFDYDMPDGMPPVLIVDDYFVKIGDHVAKRFSNKDSANDFAKIMNEALDEANKLNKMEIKEEIYEILIDENISIGRARRINERILAIFNDINKSLPDFLYEVNGRIFIGWDGDTDCTDSWNKWKSDLNGPA